MPRYDGGATGPLASFPRPRTLPRCGQKRRRRLLRGTGARPSATPEIPGIRPHRKLITRCAFRRRVTLRTKLWARRRPKPRPASRRRIAAAVCSRRTLWHEGSYRGCRRWRSRLLRLVATPCAFSTRRRARRWRRQKMPGSEIIPTLSQTPPRVWPRRWGATTCVEINQCVGCTTILH